MSTDPLVWLVTYGNYDPPEVLAIYDNEKAARDHADAEQAGSPLLLEVVPWTLRSTYRDRHDKPEEGS